MPRYRNSEPAVPAGAGAAEEVADSFRPSEAVVSGGKKRRLSDLASLSAPPRRRRLRIWTKRANERARRARARRGETTAGTSLGGEWREGEDTREEMLAGKVGRVATGEGGGGGGGEGYNGKKGRKLCEVAEEEGYFGKEGEGG